MVFWGTTRRIYGYLSLSLQPHVRGRGYTTESGSGARTLFTTDGGRDGRSVFQGRRWTVHDGESWAIIGPASEAGGAARSQVVKSILGVTSLRPQHVSFSTRMGSGGGGEFTNFAARYGAIRDEDRVSLYERLMDIAGVATGLVAAQRMQPDPLAAEAEVGRFKWASEDARQLARQEALDADRRIRDRAPLLEFNEDMLRRPVIALSNGQTRRARILSALVGGAQLVVLEEPYSGIDADTRRRLATLFGQLHSNRQPRLVLVLREQDAVPDYITHVMRINEDGELIEMGARARNANVKAASASAPDTFVEATGSNKVAANAAAGIGVGDAAQDAVVALNGITIAYGSKVVLDDIHLRLVPGDRLVLAGANGSGKTTMLAIMLGDHARSFSFSKDEFSLFGAARDAPANARVLLSRRVGYVSPEVFNAFPRRAGLSVGEVVASGFENVFARRTYSDAQKERVWGLLAHFVDLIRGGVGGGEGEGEGEGVREVSRRTFAELSIGSQAVVMFLRAVVGNPQLLVLDEPFQGMDTRQVARVRRFIDDMVADEQDDPWLTGDRAADKLARRQTAVVLVSHYEHEWPGTFGRLLRLQDGRVVEQI